MVRQREPLFTLPTPQLLALDEALEMSYVDAAAAATQYADYRALGTWVRAELLRRGLKALVEEESAAPTICTFVLPVGSAERCRRAGFHIACESGYLRQRRWGQISVMGELDAETIAPVFDLL
jgi:aspartate aminotransferase-like enzyme